MTDGNWDAPGFDAPFRARFEELLRWRRDVREFRTEALPDGIVEKLVGLAALAPSVGYSQPWRFVSVEDEARRAAVRESFEQANQDALEGYGGEQKQLYARLKLEGLDRAPAQLAVFTDHGTERGHGLGRQTMPEMLDYSTVTAIHTFWLAARSHGIGVGWVSILDPDRVTAALEVPQGWHLTAYLCVGYPEAEEDRPKLQQVGWEEKAAESRALLKR
ncbi:5,6-dimethylbenzimidazole synthase [Nisaea acidiphila]|uniref:5,6-dimethylbenzimidazole synthase n=1 Tax=Nisaea acidiphila TaxID=1862145 RepID=A0A9J7AX08_9PROT|nr:5,6-dimethylbenzimidazole synthase [Nisaea acidiphila]UUX50788.1 5,6-dimethylbenzimidazole synthase [Nisaea acidiphila]